MTKTIYTIPKDIEQLFREGCVPSEANLTVFLDNVKETLIKKLGRGLEPEQPQTIRMSKLGTPDRKLWFEHHIEAETDFSNSLKFLYGDIIEQLVLLLLKESGHTVEEEQAEVEIDGIKGHKDAKVDGVCVDIKSASSFAFRKFASGALFNDDPFGYVAQLSSYSWPDPAAFIAVNKENGEVSVLALDPIDMIDPKARIKRVKEVVALPAPPDKKCYPDEPVGKSGNRGLSKNCGYCAFKHKCWEGLRTFKYASGPVYLTTVVETPSVMELTEIP